MGDEFAFIDATRIRAGRRVPTPVLGIGDDCAGWAPSPGHDQLVSTDLLIEGVHFSLETTSLADLGHKSLAVNLSDMAAMGGIARHITLGLACPLPPERYRPLMDGLMELADASGVALIGGDTCASPNGLMISITILGEVPQGTAVTRSGARPGDLLYLSGPTGESAAGLALLSASEPPVLDGALADRLIQRHLRPTPRTALGALLRGDGLASAMIDVSDGVTADLGHVLDQSGVAAVIDGDALPISPALAAWCAATGADPLDLALGGGEDYELLFTVRPDREAALQRHIQSGKVNAAVIGHMVAGTGLTLRRDGQETPLARTGYEHFS